MKIDLTGKVALVTGASRGIGRAIALALGRAGASLALVATNEERLRQVAAEAGAGALVLPCDGVDIAAAIDRAGAVDILVNNAGITRDNLLIRMKDEEWSRVIEVNLTAAFAAIKAASRHMLRKRWGRIINITSISGITGNAGQANYAAAKAGLIGLTKSAAKELASRNITVNAIAPGFIETDMTTKLGDKVVEQMRTLIPLGCFGKPDDVANLATFLASERSGYVTGQVIGVYFGLSI